jgi:hypothetical protein
MEITTPQRRPFRRGFYRLTFAVGLGLAMFGCESKITEDNFAKLTQGMTQNEVEKILGKGTDETPEGVSINYAGAASADKGKTTVIRYKDGRKSIVVNFRDGKALDFLKDGF